MVGELRCESTPEEYNESHGVFEWLAWSHKTTTPDSVHEKLENLTSNLKHISALSKSEVG